MFQDAERAVFRLEGSNFILDASELSGLAQVRPGLPNGFPIMKEYDLAARSRALNVKNVTFLKETKQSPASFHGQPALYLTDSEGNVLVFAGRGPDLSGATGITGFEGGSSFIAASKKVAEAWTSREPEAIAAVHSGGGEWVDSTRLRFRGRETETTLPSALPLYWNEYGAARPLAVEWRARAMRELQADGITIVSYERRLSNAALQETALVTHAFKDPRQILVSTFVEANPGRAMVVALDYAAHPVLDLKEAAGFYQSKLGLGAPYKDDSWRGFWGKGAVLGIYESDFDADRVPVKNRANGYISFWVRSAESVYGYLKKSGASFPHLPAINDRPGLESHPGYKQVVATDSEGNVVLFTEYTGRVR